MDFVGNKNVNKISKPYLENDLIYLLALNPNEIKKILNG